MLKYQQLQESAQNSQSYWTSSNSMNLATSGNVNGLNYTCSAGAPPSTNYSLSAFA